MAELFDLGTCWGDQAESYEEARRLIASYNGFALQAGEKGVDENRTNR
jgi:hypothetical protein